MGPTQVQYSEWVIRRKLGINTALATTGVAYGVLCGFGWTVLDFAVLALVGFSLYRIYESAIILVNRPPAIIISDDGLRDAQLGGMLIPWSSISEILMVAPERGVGLMLMVDTTQLASMPGPVLGRLVNFVTGARPRARNRRMALFMTPAIALDVSMYELVEQIRARAPATRIRIRRGLQRK